jgi:ABC-type anion transport system duplicated permease subunit
MDTFIGNPEIEQKELKTALSPIVEGRALEKFYFKAQTLSTTGLGATISQATDGGNFNQLLAATIVMAVIVVTINRLLWRRLYRLAQTRFKLEA